MLQNVSVYIRRTKISIFSKALKSVGKLFGVGGSTKPLEVDPVKQAAKVKSDAQLETNKTVQSTVRGEELSSNNQSLNPLATDTAVNAEANKALAPPSPRKWGNKDSIFKRAIERIVTRSQGR